MTNRNVVHVEFSSRNFDESGKFYHELFGWKITTAPEFNYMMWEAADHTGGGFNPVGEHAKAGEVMVYIDSDDIEADLKKVKALGGTVLTEKTEIPQTGWFATFKDPTGNLVALFTGMKQS